MFEDLLEPPEPTPVCFQLKTRVELTVKITTWGNSVPSIQRCENLSLLIDQGTACRTGIRVKL
jgi:hypothetical protein